MGTVQTPNNTIKGQQHITMNIRPKAYHTEPNRADYKPWIDISGLLLADFI